MKWLFIPGVEVLQNYHSSRKSTCESLSYMSWERFQISMLRLWNICEYEPLSLCVQMEMDEKGEEWLVFRIYHA